MKTKRTFLSILTLCIALLFTACSGKGTAGTEKSQNTKTESGSKSVSAKYSCGFSIFLVSSIIVGERYLDYFTTITEDRL